jgi:putative transposase
MKSSGDFFWLYEVDSQSSLAGLGNLHAAFQNFFKGQSGFPTFTSRKSN